MGCIGAAEGADGPGATAAGACMAPELCVCCGAGAPASAQPAGGLGAGWRSRARAAAWPAERVSARSSGPVGLVPPRAGRGAWPAEPLGAWPAERGAWPAERGAWPAERRACPAGPPCRGRLHVGHDRGALLPTPRRGRGRGLGLPLAAAPAVQVAPCRSGREGLAGCWAPGWPFMAGCAVRWYSAMTGAV